MEIIRLLEKLVLVNDLIKVKKEISSFYNDVKNNSSDDNVFYRLNGEKLSVRKIFLLNELDQISKTRTLERTHYYINRLLKSLVKEKTGKINDLNLNRWKEYDDIFTDSLWLIDRRDKSGVHKADYWGNFIPQIPNQFIRRYTRKGDWILDPFSGSGTTLIECKRLGRNGFGIELDKNVFDNTKKIISKEKNEFDVNTYLFNGDSRKFDIKSEMRKNKIQNFQFILFHPPYWDIIKFSNDKNDLSNAKTISEFLKMFGEVLDNTLTCLEKGRYFAVVIGDKYSSGEWIPLGFFVMQEVLKRNCRLKSTIVKNFDQTLGKRNQKELWRYRALAGGFYIFKHEYIFLFQK